MRVPAAAASPAPAAVPAASAPAAAPSAAVVVEGAVVVLLLTELLKAVLATSASTAYWNKACRILVCFHTSAECVWVNPCARHSVMLKLSMLLIQLPRLSTV